MLVDFSQHLLNTSLNIELITDNDGPIFREVFNRINLRVY